MRYNAMIEMFELIEVFGEPTLFTNIKIDHTTVPDCLNMYEVKGNTESGVPLLIAEKVTDDFMGTILTKEPIMLDAHGYCDITLDDEWDYGDEVPYMIDDFINSFITD